MQPPNVLHEIRLREPWKPEVDGTSSKEDADDGKPSPEFNDHWFVRSFHAPTGLTPNECVELSITRRDPSVMLELLGVTLNDQALAHQFEQQQMAWRANLGETLLPFNALRMGLRISKSLPAPKLSDLLDVRLQIIKRDGH